MRRVLIAVAIAAVSFAAPAYSVAQGLQVDSIVEREIKTVDAKGEIQITREIADLVVPGEELIYTISYHNQGAAPADGVVLTNPIPDQMSYSDGTAIGEGASVVFSVDKGVSFDAWNNLFVTDSDGTRRQAAATDYTHVRWVMGSTVGAGKKGSVSFRAILN